VPAVALKIALGAELAANTLLTSQRVVPTALLEKGFVFRAKNIDEVVAEALT
jgi:NAD dependent epimerase/dehydratase family enzyme